LQVFLYPYIGKYPIVDTENKPMGINYRTYAKCGRSTQVFSD